MRFDHYHQSIPISSTKYREQPYQLPADRRPITYESIRINKVFSRKTTKKMLPINEQSYFRGENKSSVYLWIGSKPNTVEPRANLPICIEPRAFQTWSFVSITLWLLPRASLSILPESTLTRILSSLKQTALLPPIQNYFEYFQAKRNSTLSGWKHKTFKELNQGLLPNR